MSNRQRRCLQEAVIVDSKRVTVPRADLKNDTSLGEWFEIITGLDADKDWKQLDLDTDSDSAMRQNFVSPST